MLRPILMSPLDCGPREASSRGLCTTARRHSARQRGGTRRVLCDVGTSAMKTSYVLTGYIVTTKIANCGKKGSMKFSRPYKLIRIQCPLTYKDSFLGLKHAAS